MVEYDFKVYAVNGILGREITAYHSFSARSRRQYIIAEAKKDFGISITSKAWSKWSYEEYIAFQEKIRNILTEKGIDQAPINWECEAWIKVAQNRKSKIQK